MMKYTILEPVYILLERKGTITKEEADLARNTFKGDMSYESFELGLEILKEDLDKLEKGLL